MRCAALISAIFIVTGSVGVAAAQVVPAPTVHSGWKKLCRDDPKTGRICHTRAETRNKADKSLLAAVVVIEAQGQPGNILRVVVPLGMQLKHGTRLIVLGNEPVLAPFTMCILAGCKSDYEATPELLDSMKAERLTVQAIDAKGKPLSVMVSLAGFQAAYDGPFTGPLVDEFEEPRRAIGKPSKSRAARRHRSPGAQVLARRHLESASSADLVR